MTDWKPYLNERLIQEKKGFYVIKPISIEASIPLSCEVCQFLFRTRDDENSFKEFGCCEKCALRWVHPDRERWKSGYRPSVSEINDELLVRSKITVSIE